MARDPIDQDELLAGLPPVVEFLFQLERLKDLERQNPLCHNGRRERVAEHSWHVAIAAVLLTEFSPERDRIDVAHAALLAVVHDVVELLVGDTFAFGAGTDGQESRERTAMAKLRDTLDAPAIQRLVDLWEEYEAQQTPEARFVKGLDTFLPIVQNYTNIENSSWIRHHVKAAQVRRRLERAGSSIGSLAATNRTMISDAQARGYLA